MKKIKKIGLFLMALVAILAIFIGIFAYSLKPDYDGEKPLPNLSNDVTVYYDSFGIPHIYGTSEKDAFRALGYVHAQDRLWQMELLRRIASGGLSEVFGEDMIKTDKFFLSLGIDENSNKIASQLNVNSKEMEVSQAYLDGINQFIAEGPKPVEFYLTGIKRTPFELKDIYNTMGYMAFSFAMAHKTDPLLSNLKNKLGAEYLVDLGLDVHPNTEWIQNHKRQKKDTIQNNITAMLNEALGEIDIPLFEGSNGWAIAPEKTKNGKVILANDPHIGFSQPSVWYEAHVNAPGYERYGYHIAGIPFPILGHNRSNAYGMTMFENDDIDFYYEEENQSNKDQYKNNGQWVNYEKVTKVIKVKDAEDYNFTFKKTHHGPVLNHIADQVTGERPISMSWVYTKGENKLMHAFYEMSHASELDTFESALKDIHAPGLNIMYGDAKGNIAWWATARLYQIPDSVNTKLVFEPGEGLHEDKKILPFSENPQAINPPWNYVYSANNQPDSIAGMKYPGYYLPENRAKRIVALLEPKNDWDKTAVGYMINDITSSVNPEIIKNFAKAIVVQDLTEKELKILDKLNSWEGDYPVEGIEGTLFHRWVHYFLKNTFEDEMGQEMFNQFTETHLRKRVVALIAEKQNSIWWDNINTKDKVETQAQIIQTSFTQSLADLEKNLGENIEDWKWGNVHTIEHGHPIGQVEMLRSFFNVGPFPVNGTREVINNLAFSKSETGHYEVSSGPSTRRVIDFSDIENSMSILPTGQSGNPFSKHYSDQSIMYINGEFRKMLLNKEEIIKTSASTLVLKP